jgi:branched-subunit amino acid transport protein
MTTSIPASNIWFITIAVAIITFGLRLSFFLIFGRVDEIPSWAACVLRYVAPAVLAALVLPELVYIGGAISILNPRLIAGVVAGIVAWRTENLTVTVMVGMIVFWGTRGLI